VVAMQESLATLYLKNASKALEAATFLSLISLVIVSEISLPIENYNCESGKIFAIDTQKLTAKFSVQVTNVIHSAYSVLNKVFNQSINSVNYQKWYTEISHRVRHSVSKTYTIVNCGSITVYGKTPDAISIVEFGVVEALRNRGIATKLLNHVYADNRFAKVIILHSQDSSADGFYEKTGFIQTGDWYHYVK
ncbi:MAG: GNAT family N-acetyltransferase, partial [Oscillospiraceae bacterium]